MSASDSLSLRITVVERDDPAAQLLIISGGLGGPACRMVIWSDYGGYQPAWDYGRPVACPGSVLWAGMGTPIVNAGSFDFFLPFQTMSGFPPRCGWAVQLRWSSGRKSSLLAKGTLHLSGPDQEMQALQALFTDNDVWIHTDNDEGMLV